MTVNVGALAVASIASWPSSQSPARGGYGSRFLSWIRGRLRDLAVHPSRAWAHLHRPLCGTRRCNSISAPGRNEAVVRGQTVAKLYRYSFRQSSGASAGKLEKAVDTLSGLHWPLPCISRSRESSLKTSERRNSAALSWCAGRFGIVGFEVSPFVPKAAYLEKKRSQL